MADAQMGPVTHRFVDKRRGRSNDQLTLAEAANYTSISAIKARLAALKPSSYTAGRMNTMTTNDLVHALRLESADVAGIK